MALCNFSFRFFFWRYFTPSFLSAIGDIIGVTGTVFKTNKGELSVRATKISLLTKSLRPLPDKWSGLTDTEVKYRQRYVDLIVNEQARKTFRIRSKVVTAIRDFMIERDFM